nr:conserved hypothetical protein [uncultured archaeon GZfos27B6]
MQDRKEDSAFSVKNIREKVRDWKSQNLLTVRLFEYILLLGLVTFVIGLIFSCFNLIHTDPTSARYMLSALVQSQAAIIAIVVSLTLIAVQHTASAYSPRVIRIFRNNPDMWILLGLYGFSIFYGLLVLKMIRGAEDTSQIMISSISLEAYISTVYALGISTFAILCLYIWNIMSLLTPETIIKRLKNEITKGNLLTPEEDPIQPIMDIIHGSIMKYDLETTRVGLKAVTDQVIEIIDPTCEREISGNFCNHLYRVSRLAISRDDEESAEDVMNRLEEFGLSSAEKGLEDTTVTTVRFLGLIGRTAMEKKLEYAAFMAATNLADVGRAAAGYGLEGAVTAAVSHLREFGRTAVEKEVKNVLTTAVKNLGEIGSETANQKLEDVTKRAVESLRDIGESIVEKEFEDSAVKKEVAIKGVVASLVLTGVAAAKKYLEDATYQAALSLVTIRMSATEKGFEVETESVALDLAILTILSEDPVKNAIREYESNLEEHKRNSFQKFMEQYEQELEKQRAEN